jgi:curli biogenesis system outer membrane secretion channel CsgG
MMMSVVLLMVATLLLLGPGAARAADPPKSSGPDISSAQATAYDGPKARIAVKDFEDKMSSSGVYRGEYGRGLSDMLTTALFQTNRYIVLEREKLAGVVSELKHGTSDLFRKEATVTIGELEGAELLVTAAITGFDPGTSGVGANLGGTIGGLFGGAAGKVLGSVVGGISKARAAMDLRVIDVRTSRVVAATHSEGTATTFSGGVGAGSGSMGGGLSGFSKTPMESAIREMIGNAVAFVVSKTPETYYRYGPGGAVIPPGPAATAALAPVPASTTPLTPGPGQAIQVIKADGDRDLLVQLDDVKLRGAVLSVVVSFTMSKAKPESEPIEVNQAKTHVMDYSTGQTYPIITVEGFSAGRIKAGEVKTLRLMFRAPKDATTVGINLSGVGAFDDVKLGR